MSPCHPFLSAFSPGACAPGSALASGLSQPRRHPATRAGRILLLPTVWPQGTRPAGPWMDTCCGPAEAGSLTSRWIHPAHFAFPVPRLTSALSSPATPQAPLTSPPYKSHRQPPSRRPAPAGRFPLGGAPDGAVLCRWDRGGFCGCGGCGSRLLVWAHDC